MRLETCRLSLKQTQPILRPYFSLMEFVYAEGGPRSGLPMQRKPYVEWQPPPPNTRHFEHKHVSKKWRLDLADESRLGLAPVIALVSPHAPTLPILVIAYRVLLMLRSHASLGSLSHRSRRGARHRR